MNMARLKPHVEYRLHTSTHNQLDPLVVASLKHDCLLATEKLSGYFEIRFKILQQT